MPRQDLPSIDPRKCTSCGDCVVLCPTACLTLRDFLPVVEPAACISCAVCEQVCLPRAIVLVPVDW